MVVGTMVLLQRLCLTLLLCIGVRSSSPLGSPSGSASGVKRATFNSQNGTPRKLRGRFLHITDLHPDSFYKAHSSTDETNACHRGIGSAGPFGAEASDCDSPYALINATFDWIEANLKDQIDFVIWTGDSARHDSDEEIPRTQAQVISSNRFVAGKFIDTFADATASTGLAIPVIPTYGNNDILPHNILLPGPNKWLQVYSDIWRRFIPEEQRHSFEFGGWFYVEAIPGRLAVFSLNTLYFFDRNAGVDDCATPSDPGYKQFEWLRVQLQFMRERGMKAILMGHVPPARTDSKQLWSEPCWQKYTLWLQQYRDVVISGLFGHMNIDHFLLQDTKDIDPAKLAESVVHQISTREAMDDEFTVESATDYLHELRKDWSKLEPPPAMAGKPGRVGQDKSKKRKKGGKKHKGDLWGERYQLSLVSPSIVPTYFPTLRVFEYNITGLENAALWKDTLEQQSDITVEEPTQKHLDLRDVSQVETEANTDKNRKKKKKKKKKKKPKHKKPKDPKLIVPEPPSKSSPPGPAYSPQPLTLIGYTQYYANLTFINNLTFDDPSISSSADDEFSLFESLSDWLLRWRQGKHGNRKPKNPAQPQPREFHFEVEYSTFDDKIYRLGDLTVNSFVDLAYRIGQRTKGASVEGVEGGLDGEGEGYEEEEDGEDWEDSEDEFDSEEEDSDDDEDDDDSVEAEGKKDGKNKEGKGGKDKGKKGKKGKHGGGKKKKKTKKQNKAWLHFLDHAFVGTVEKKELKKFALD